MKKTYKIDVDCANCANKMEAAAAKVEGVASVSVNFMNQKMTVEFASDIEDKDEKKVMKEVRKQCRKVEDDCEIYIC
ncbi:MAG: cation transporter [Clostridia bacterium]|nr:cation transporter [Clostridia bacterium]